ncbi:MAG: hypothetical protein GIW99_10230, partial [Candidatus Eremiobacteraeota bacterium]|nr:hypothetical protein [Candidatus Eremiobacteraeota bacterium]
AGAHGAGKADDARRQRNDVGLLRQKDYGEDAAAYFLGIAHANLFWADKFKQFADDQPMAIVSGHDNVQTTIPAIRAYEQFESRCHAYGGLKSAVISAVGLADRRTHAVCANGHTLEAW